MFIMYDNVNLDLIPKEPHAVASYINGNYTNHEEAVKRFPHARHLGISIVGATPAECYDIETGDYTPQHVPDLYKLAFAAHIWRPCFYANLSTMPAVKAELSKANIMRSDVRLWVAYYDNIPNIPEGYDAHQFTDRALGRSLDESICRSDFFQPAKPAPEPDRDPLVYRLDKDLGDSFMFQAVRINRKA